MRKEKILKSLSIHLLSLIIILTGFVGTKMDAHAADIPNISLTFDSSDQSVIVSGIPAYDSTGAIQYELNKRIYELPGRTCGNFLLRTICLSSSYPG